DDESEALLGVVELHLPAWHVDTVLRRWCCGPLVALIADLSIPGWSSPVGWPGRTREADDLAGLPVTVRRRSILQGKPPATGGTVAPVGAGRRPPTQRRLPGGISRSGASHATASRPSPVRTCSRIIAVNPHTKTS